MTSNILGGGGEERDFKNVKLYKKIWEYISEDVEKQLRAVVKKKREADIKFKSGTSVPIDPDAASTILKTLDSLNSTNKKKMRDNMNKDTKSFLKILDFAFDNVR